MCRREQEAIVRSRIAERGGFDGIIQSTRAVKLPEGFLLYSRKCCFINGNAAPDGQVKCENGQNIVVARDARTLGNERRSGAFQQRKGFRNRLPNLCAVLSPQERGS